MPIKKIQKHDSSIPRVKTMKSFLPSTRLVSLIIFAAVTAIFTACGRTISLQTPTVEATSTVTPVKTAAQTETAAPTNTPIPQDTPTPVPTNTLPPTVTPTLAPRLPSAEPPVVSPGAVISPQNAARVVELAGWGQGYDFNPFLGNSRLAAHGQMLVAQDIISENPPDVWQRLFWDLPSGQLRLARIENLDLGDLYLSPDGTRFAIFHNTCHSENPKPCLLEVFSIPANERLISFDPGFVQAAVFSPDNRLIALGTDKEVAIWDINTGTLQRTLPNSFRLDYLKFSNDGELLAGFQRQGDGHIKIWQVESGELRATLTYRLYPMIMFPDAMAFSPDATHLAISYGGSAEFWRVSDWREGPTWQWNELGGITDIAFSPDGRLVASGASDGSITLASEATGKVLARWDSHTDDTYDYITNLSFTPDGRLLISLSMDGTLRFWGIKAE